MRCRHCVKFKVTHKSVVGGYGKGIRSCGGADSETKDYILCRHPNEFLAHKFFADNNTFRPPQKSDSNKS